MTTRHLCLPGLSFVQLLREYKRERDRAISGQDFDAAQMDWAAQDIASHCVHLFLEMDTHTNHGKQVGE